MTDIQRIARIDARGWCARNPKAIIVDQVIKNHYSMSRERGYLGTVSRAPQGEAWNEYRAEFLDEIERQHMKGASDVSKRTAARSGL